MIISVWKKWMYIGHPKKVYDFSLQQLLYILRMVQNCQSIINQLALAIGQAKLWRELLLFKNHPNVPIMSKKITNSICTFQLLKLNQEERSLLRSHSWWLMDDVIVIICHLNSSNLLLYMYSTSSTRWVHVLNYYLVLVWS